MSFLGPEKILCGFSGKDQIPKPPYYCRSCKRNWDRANIEKNVIHFKMKRKSESGFFESWTLKCPSPICQEPLREPHASAALAPEPEQMGLF